MPTVGTELIVGVAGPATPGTVIAGIAAATRFADCLWRLRPIRYCRLPPQLPHSSLNLISGTCGCGRGFSQAANCGLHLVLDVLASIPGGCGSRGQGIEALQDAGRFSQQLPALGLVLLIRHFSGLVIEIEFANPLQDSFFLRLQRFAPAYNFFSLEMPREKGAHHDDAYHDKQGYAE